MDPQALIRRWFGFQADIDRATADGNAELAAVLREDRRWAERDYTDWIRKGGAPVWIRTPAGRERAVAELHWPCVSLRNGFGVLPASRVTLL